MPRHRKTITTLEREYIEAVTNGEQLRPVTMDDVLKAKADAEARRAKRRAPKFDGYFAVVNLPKR